MPQDNEQEQLLKLIEIVQTAIQQDEQLRQKYQVGEKFRFIRDRLQLLLQSFTVGSVTQETTIQQTVEIEVKDDEFLAYVHLYNTQGTVVRSWKNIIHPKAFFDYSVNRPIYNEKKHIEAFVCAKINKAQHGYLTVVVKKERVTSQDGSLKDAMGNPLIKVKEGSLVYEKMLSFTHIDCEYVIGEGGELVRRGGIIILQPCYFRLILF